MDFSRSKGILLFSPGRLHLMSLKFTRLERGFTMIEMLTVLAIIGILMSISLVAYAKYREKARLARVKSNVGEIAMAIDDFARDHNGKYPALVDYHNIVPDGSTTSPVAPANFSAGVPTILKRKGNAIIGGGPPLKDNGSVQQDDFYRDEMNPPSAFRQRQGEPAFGSGAMHPVDVLILNGQLKDYPFNPLAGPGVSMLNIAHILYDYDSQSNDFTWVTITCADGDIRTGLCAALPFAQANLGGLYRPIPMQAVPNSAWTEDTYPKGNFAYIPFEFTSEEGKYCNGYWIISYGDITTFKNSPYNKFSFGPGSEAAFVNWPNLPRPYGDGDPSTPPDPLSFEYQVKRMIYGALDVRATIFEDQLVIK
jgi:prepilin-type N-terminal cleavage/methylation domain-containing protein